MNLRDFLQQREKELAEQIAKLHSEVAPLEKDLATYQQAQAVAKRPLKEFTVGESACGDALAEYPKPSPASTALRQFLVQHEEELTAQLSALRADLMPLEAELAEVRRAKAAIGLNVPQIASTVEGIAQVIAGVGRVAIVLNAAQKRAAEILEAGQKNNTIDMTPTLPTPSPYANLTMKQLVVKVLTEHFHNGATTRQMIDFFRDAWGRDIERQNLSPQISRLYQEGVIGRIRTTRGWFLYKKDGTITGFRPYRHLGRIVWCEPLSTDYQ
jgi:prefoldin subunit 5